MLPNLDRLERMTRFLFGIVMLFAAWQLFAHPAARIAAALFGLYAFWEAASGKCPLQAFFGRRASSDRLPAEKRYMIGLAAIQAVLAYEWLHAGWGKVTSPDFAGGLGKTLAAFAAKNRFDWFKSFLEGFATRNSFVLGYAVEYGQLLIGATLVIAVIVFLRAESAGTRRIMSFAAAGALAGGMIMNASFYLASGWMSPSSSGINMIMFWTQAILACVWLGAAARSK